jgi:hypothetical protein
MKNKVKKNRGAGNVNWRKRGRRSVIKIMWVLRTNDAPQEELTSHPLEARTRPFRDIPALVVRLEKSTCNATWKTKHKDLNAQLLAMQQELQKMKTEKQQERK